MNNQALTISDLKKAWKADAVTIKMFLDKRAITPQLTFKHGRGTMRLYDPSVLNLGPAYHAQVKAAIEAQREAFRQRGPELREAAAAVLRRNAEKRREKNSNIAGLVSRLTQMQATLDVIESALSRLIGDADRGERDGPVF